MNDGIQASDDAQDKDEDDTPAMSLVEEVDAIVNLLRFVLDWSTILDDGSTILGLKVEDALEEAVKWRARLLN